MSEKNSRQVDLTSWRGDATGEEALGVGCFRGISPAGGGILVAKSFEIKRSATESAERSDAVT